MTTLYELSQLLEPAKDGEPPTRLRVAGVVQNDPLIVNLGGQQVNAYRVGAEMYDPGAIVVALTIENSPPYVLGTLDPEWFYARRLRATASNDVSHTSTLHGFQIGSDNAENLRMDINEILCSNNGAASKLFIQGDSALGGDVGIGHGAAGSLVDICSQPFSPIGNNGVGSGWSSASGWSVTINQCRRIGPMCAIAGSAERTGADITVSSTGDIGNTAIATASGTNANGNSNVHWGLSGGSVGRLVTVTFNPSSGQLTLCAISPSVNISTGNTISFAGIVPVEVR